MSRSKTSRYAAILLFSVSVATTTTGCERASDDPALQQSQIVEQDDILLEQALVYDVASKRTEQLLLTSAKEELEKVTNLGSGVLADHTSFSQSEITDLAATEAYFAPYEVRDGPKDADGNFQPFSVIEPDTREVVVDTTLPEFRAIVQINFEKGGSIGRWGCSGALISPAVVLTAGHCVYTNNKWHTSFSIYPARNGGAMPYGNCGAEKLYTINGWMWLSDDIDSREYDIGAIKLDCDIGLSTGWFTLGSLPTDTDRTDAMIIGYPCDKLPGGRQWVSVDELRKITPLKMFYQNDTYGCMSGAPIFFDDGSRIIFGVHTNGIHGTGDWSTNNAGTRLTGQRILFLSSWLIE